jgi:hypothetical protein
LKRSTTPSLARSKSSPSSVDEPARPAVSDFSLYDALLAGLASRAAQDHFDENSAIPAPDEPTTSYASMLRKKGGKSSAEIAFLEYFDLLEEIDLFWTTSVGASEVAHSKAP